MNPDHGNFESTIFRKLWFTLVRIFLETRVTGCPTIDRMRLHGRVFMFRLTLDKPFKGIFPDRAEQLVIVEKKNLRK